MIDAHPSAVISKAAHLDEGVRVGPFAIIEGDARVGGGCVVEAHSIVRGGVVVGERNVFGHGSVIGGDPQDRKYAGEPTYLRIGNNNVIREFSTVHRATGEGNSTIIGDDNYLMAYTHIGHNTKIANNCTIANNAGMAGHVTIEDGVNIGGMVGIHQFTRVGKFAMIGGFSRVTRDVPPFMLVEGSPLQVYDINAVGLRRLGVSANSRLALHKACKLLFRSEMGLTKAIEVVRREVEMTEEVEYVIAFVEKMGAGRFGRQDQK